MTYQIICGYGVRHQEENGKYECNCEKTFGFSEWQIQKYVLEKYGYYYPSKITKDIRKDFWQINHARNGNVINNQK